MKNLKSLNRANLKSLNGGSRRDERQIDSDCSPIPGCCIGRPFLGRKVCIMFSYDPTTNSCP